MLLTNGAVVGAIAALIGTVAGLALWSLRADTRVRGRPSHRSAQPSVDAARDDVLLAVLGATAAAWWPGRAVARLPVTLALSGRPPKPRPARHSAIAAAALIAAGIGCLALSDRDRAPLIIAGIVATILGTLLLGPLAIRIFAGRRTRPDRAAPGAARPRPLPGPLRGGTRGGHPRSRHRRDSVVIAAAEEKKETTGGRRAPQPVRPPDPRVHRPDARPGARPLPLETPAQLAREAARVRQIAAVSIRRP